MAGIQRFPSVTQADAALPQVKTYPPFTDGLPNATLDVVDEDPSPLIPGNAWILRVLDGSGEISHSVAQYGLMMTGSDENDGTLGHSLLHYGLLFNSGDLYHYYLSYYSYTGNITRVELENL